MKFHKIYCGSITYRSALVEVMPNIHPGHINVEIGNFHPDFSQTTANIKDDSVPEEAITGNTEIELEIAQAKKLVKLLNLAIQAAEITGRDYVL